MSPTDALASAVPANAGQSVAEGGRGILEKPAGKTPRAGAVVLRPGAPAGAIRLSGTMAEGTAKGRPRSPLDRIVAAVAEAHRCVVVTENERDFAGLKIVNPLRAGDSCVARCSRRAKI